MAQAWDVPLQGVGKRMFGKCVREATTECMWQRAQAVHTKAGVEPGLVGHHGADDVYVATMCPTRNDAARWGELLPLQSARVELRRMKLGLMPEIRRTKAKACGAAVRALPVELRVDCMRCPCGGGTQDARHVLLRCAFTQGARDAMLSAASQSLQAGGVSGAIDWWTSLVEEQQVLHLMSSRVVHGVPLESCLRRAAVPVFVNAMQAALADIDAMDVRMEYAPSADASMLWDVQSEHWLDAVAEL